MHVEPLGPRDQLADGLRRKDAELTRRTSPLVDWHQETEVNQARWQDLADFAFATVASLHTAHVVAGGAPEHRLPTPGG